MWEDKIWARGYRSKVHFCTYYNIGNVRELASRDASQQVAYTCLHFRKLIWAGIYIWESSAKDD